MGSLPDLIFIIDTVREQIAIKEAIKLNIPIAAIIDTNSDPEGITYPIPGNDDSTKSIKLYCDLISQAALDGISIQSQKIQDESQNKKEKPQKESASNVNNDSKELLDPETNETMKCIFSDLIKSFVSKIICIVKCVTPLLPCWKS